MRILWKNPIFGFCMVVFPIAVLMFFTTMLEQGVPENLPIGVVDADNTSTSRSLVRRLDAFQSSHVVAHFPTAAEARHAMQRNEIYAFLYIPKGTTDDLLASRQPKISYYYSMTTMVAGALLYRDLKTIATLGSASVGQATMRAKGYTDRQIKTFLQPIAIDLHQISNSTITPTSPQCWCRALSCCSSFLSRRIPWVRNSSSTIQRSGWPWQTTESA